MSITKHPIYVAVMAELQSAEELGAAFSYEEYISLMLAVSAECTQRAANCAQEAKKKAEASKLTLEKFRASGTKVPDLRNFPVFDEMHDEDRPYPGLIYDPGDSETGPVFWIEEKPDGNFYTMMFNEDCLGNLDACERFLFDRISERPL